MSAPNGETPEGGYNGLGGLQALSQKTNDQVMSELTNPAKDSYGKVGGWSGGLFAALQGLFSGGGILGLISGFFNGKWAQVQDHESSIKDLQDVTTVLEGVTGLGQWTDASSQSIIYSSNGSTWQTHNAGTQIGSIVGCTLVSPGVVQLNSKGAWQIQGRAHFGSTPLIGPNFIDYQIEVSNDNFATIYAAVFSGEVMTNTGGTSADPGTRDIFAIVVVPDVGYRVRWRIKCRPARYMGTGNQYNNISVFHLSDELGPGMRLRDPFTIASTDWVKVGPMVATGGGTVSADAAVVQAGVTNVRIDAVLTGSANFDARMIARGTDVVAESLNKSAHALLSQGAATPGDKFDLWVRDASGTGQVTLNAVNGTWLTIMNRDLTNSSAPPAGG